jgi:pimeloyl-ACP methyl ester carboxylesterase
VSERIEYDEFGFFHENAAEFGLPYPGPPEVRREFVEVGPGRRLSALMWGTSAPELVLVHGAAQNAHTWDTVALAPGRPLVAIDLPGHGHSDGGRSASLLPEDNAADVAVVVEALAPQAVAVVGMSLGGLTTLALTGVAPELVRRAVLVDILPSFVRESGAAIAAFVNGPESFASLEEILERTVRFNPTRTVSSLRRGILHNAVQRDDGTWVWRHARHRAGDAPAESFHEDPDRFSHLWDAVSALKVPLMLVRGTRRGSAVGDADEAELRRRLPDARVEHVDAGHSVQGDAPLELARLIADFC